MHAIRLLGSIAVLALAGTLPIAAAADEEPHAHEHDHADHDEKEEIFITASPLTHQTDEVAAAVDEVDREEMLNSVSTTLGETLATRPGIATSGFAAGASRPVIRGQDAFRTGVVEDGLGTGDVSALSPDHGVPLNPLVAQRIEVIRGPSTLRYGGGAIAGVVNTLTGRVPRQNPETAVTGDVFGAYGFNADELMLATTLDGSLGDFVWHLDGMTTQQNDYDVPGDGDQPGSDVDARSFAVGASYIGELGRLGFGYSRFENEYGIPEEDEDVSIDLKADRYRIEGDLFEPLPGVREVRTRWAIVDYDHDEIADDMVGQTFENTEVEGRLEALHDPLLGFTGAAGAHFRTRNEEFRGEAAEYLEPTDTLSFAGYVFEEVTPIEHVDVQLGGRVERTRLEGTPFGLNRGTTEHFTPLSGSLAVLYHPDEVFTVGLTGSASQRAPSSAELFARGPHEATATFEIGDATLNEETAYTGELVFRAERAGFRGEVAGFLTYYQDYVFGQLTGVTVDEDGVPDPMGDLDQLLYTARDARFYGTELALDWEIFELCEGYLGVDAQFDYVRARFTEGSDRNVPRITPIRWGGGLFYRHHAFNGRVGFLRHERQNEVASNETRTDGYNSLDVDLSYRVEVFDGDAAVEFFANGRNLTDERGRNHISFTKDEVLLPGARVRFGVRGTF
ncbi:MAG: TonB-dependent receptor [Myxococcota bacterium]